MSAGSLRKTLTPVLVMNPPHPNSANYRCVKFGSLKWDEAKLAETEANKSATMKITEPKTPYSHGVADDSDEGEEGE
jgi:hypothetical protein